MKSLVRLWIALVLSTSIEDGGADGPRTRVPGFSVRLLPKSRPTVWRHGRDSNPCGGAYTPHPLGRRTPSSSRQPCLSIGSGASFGKRQRSAHLILPLTPASWNSVDATFASSPLQIAWGRAQLPANSPLCLTILSTRFASCSLRASHSPKGNTAWPIDTPTLNIRCRRIRVSAINLFRASSVLAGLALLIPVVIRPRVIT